MTAVVPRHQALEAHALVAGGYLLVLPESGGGGATVTLSSEVYARLFQEAETKRDFPKRASKIGSARAGKSAKLAKVRRTSTAPADWQEQVWAMRAAGTKGPAIAVALKLPAWKVYQLKDKPKVAKVAAAPNGAIDPKTKRPWI